MDELRKHDMVVARMQQAGVAVPMAETETVVPTPGRATAKMKWNQAGL